MPLTTTQIRYLRAAETQPLGAFGQKLRDGLPHKGAPAYSVVHGLMQKGLVDKESGAITQKGRGALLRDPQATSELPSEHSR